MSRFDFTRRASILLVAAALWAGVALAAPQVESVGGNLFLLEGGKRRQLTSTGRDSDAVLSPDGKWIAFVRTRATPEVDLDKEPSLREIFVLPVSGGEARLLLSRGTPCGKNRFLADFEALDFLSDSKRLAFQSSWAATHGSTHIVDVTTGACTLVAAGNRLYVVKRGQYRDHLVVSLHKYFLTSGRYDWWWLITPTGEEVGPVTPDEGDGDTLADFREMYE